MIKTGLRYLKRTLLFLLGLLGVYLLAALLLSVISTKPENIDCTRSTMIYVSTNGVHLDIILPKEQLPTHFQEALILRSNTRFVAFGWGDKGFYLETPQWDDLKLSTAINAIFLNSKTAMHLTQYRGESESWHAIPCCASQVAQLNEYIMASFLTNDQGQFVEIPDAGYTTHDKFYEAKGSYNFINTCNYWVNKGLKAAKVQTALWSPFDQGVLYHLEE